MNKRQKKKKGLLSIEKIYSNYGKKINKIIEKTTIKIVEENKTIKDEKGEDISEVVKDDKD